MKRRFFLLGGASLALTACVKPSQGVSDSPATNGGSFTTTIEVVVPKGTTGLAFVPNANRSNFADGRPAVGIALLSAGEPIVLDPNFVIQRVTLEVPAGTREAVLCSGYVPGDGYHAYFAPNIVSEWKRGKPKRGLAAVVSTAARNRLGPRLGPVERARGYPKVL